MRPGCVYVGRARRPGTWNRVHVFYGAFIPRLITTPSDTILGMGSREINCYTVKLNPGPLAQLLSSPTSNAVRLYVEEKKF